VSLTTHLAKALIRLILLFTNQRVLHKENIPSEGPLLIVANHISLADPPVVSVSINRKTVFMAKEELFKPRIIGVFLRRFGAFPVRRNHPNKEAFKNVRSVLKSGLALVIFPEGGRSMNFKLKKALPGSALIALRSGVPILPIGITGTESIDGLGWLLHRPKVVVNIGQTFTLPRKKGKLTKEELAEYTDTIMERIAELLPPEYIGRYHISKDAHHANRKSG